MAHSDRHTIRVDRQGRALIPKAVRDAMGLSEGGEAVAWLDGDRLVVEPRVALVSQLKARYRTVDGSMSEELIQERKDEAAREGRG